MSKTPDYVKKMSNPGEENHPNQQNSQNNEENPLNQLQNSQNNEENPPNQLLNPQNNEENPTNQLQNPQNNDAESPSRPWPRARSENVNTGFRPRTLTRPPMQISLENFQEALGPAPPPAPLQPPVVLNSEWRCPVCLTGFLNMRALCGHMRVHKGRNWKGIYPPPELCKPQGLGTITDLYSKKDYDPSKGNDRILPSLLGFGGPIGVGGELGMAQQMVSWVPMLKSNYQGAMGTGGEGSSSEGGVNLGKRPAAREEERSDHRLRKVRRTRVGEVPDLNVTPPQYDEPELEVEVGEGSSAPHTETQPEQQGREWNNVPHAGPETEHERKEGNNAPHDELEPKQEGIEGNNAPVSEPERDQEGREGNNVPHSESETEQKGREGNNAPHAEPEVKHEGIEVNNAPHDEPEPKEEGKEGDNAEGEGLEGEELERGAAPEDVTESEGGDRDAE